MTKGIPLGLSVEAMMAKARALSGIDLTDSDAIEPLTILHRSICEEAQLTAQGAAMIESRLLRILTNRQRMQRDFAAHPEIADQKIRAPAIICGLPRSGTTKIHKLLAASGDFNWLPFWQAFNPSLLTGDRAESPQARIDDCDDYARWLDTASPGIRPGHAFETLEPEEETTLFETSLRSTAIIAWVDVPSYVQWIIAQDPVPTFEFLRDTLKYLQWQGLADPAKRWVLKSLNYLALEPQLLQVFPDAKLVIPHRTPMQSIPSANKLLEEFRKPFSDKGINGIANAHGFAAGLKVQLAIRDEAALPILDVAFEQMIRDEDRMLDAIYAHLGETLTAKARDNMRAWNRDNPPGKHGRFVYSLEEFGLDAAAIDELFSDYIDRFELR